MPGSELATSRRGEERIDRIRRSGSSQQKALSTIAAQQLQGIELIGGLDSLAHHIEADGVRQIDDRRDDRVLTDRHGQPLDERAVDLDEVEWELPQVGERG